MTRSQLPSNDPPIFSGGYRVLAAVAKSLGYHVTVQQIVHQMGKGRGNPSTEDLMRAAKIIGMRVRLVSEPSEQKLRSLPQPAMIKFSDGGWHIFKGEVRGDRFRIHDPIEKRTTEVPMNELYARFGGEVLLVGKSFAHATEDLSFGVSWFIAVHQALQSAR